VQKVQQHMPSGAKPGEWSATAFAGPAAAFEDAVKRAGENDRIVVFGSFYTVAGVMAARKTSL
jgi:dihydrofolate synthase/folylpolyglutamate synthase